IRGQSGAAERRLRHRLLLEVASHNSRRMHTFGYHHARIDPIDADVTRTELVGKRLGYRIDSAFGGAVDRGRRRRLGARQRADVDDAAALAAEILRRLLGRQDEPEDVDVEVFVKVLFGNFLERRELVNAGVVYQDVDPA